MPVWYLLTAVLFVVTLLGLAWQPLLWGLPLLVLAAVLPLVHLPASVRRASFSAAPGAAPQRAGMYLLTAVLHMVQPVARVVGRVKGGLALRQGNGKGGFVVPRPNRIEIWSEEWRSAESWLRAIEATLQKRRAFVARGGDYDRWDLQLQCGLFGEIRSRMAIEEHGAGKQLVRLKVWPRLSNVTLAVVLGLGGLATWAGIQGRPAICIVLGAMSASVLLPVLKNWSDGIQTFREALSTGEGKQILARVQAQRVPPRPEMVRVTAASGILHSKRER
jgi:hypothetical protein